MAQFDWDSLRFFLAVAREKSALKASHRLDVNQSTVSRHVHRLEQDMGAQLFQRHSQGHILTSVGQRLLEQVEKVEAILNTTQQDVRGGISSLTGEIRLGATEGFGSFFLAPHLARFSRLHPGLTVELLPMPRHINLSKREADFSISLERPSIESLIVSKLTDYRLMPYASQAYLDEVGPIQGPEDLRHLRWIDYVDDLLFTKEQFSLKQWMPSLTPFFKSTSIIAQYQAVCSGLGIAILPCFMGQLHPQLVPVLAEQVDIRRSFWLTSTPDQRDLSRVRALWDYLRHVMALNADVLMGKAHQMQWLDEWGPNDQ
ncbi:LysR family transcriptional regulator [Lampropedia puyangensis]|uniref:LysR family transcriptional regulator n=1 Tax=Lampropedia puyangensis TaxID=1330072 RepID=A0A4S8FCZ9_9BURK|nr:LysR family transcriptional regulator [Lampropedia puyangensis]THU05031.1 LysR family transcriptional regulator [Lampropedia puyangensis]